MEKSPCAKYQERTRKTERERERADDILDIGWQQQQQQKQQHQEQQQQQQQRSIAKEIARQSKVLTFFSLSDAGVSRWNEFFCSWRFIKIEPNWSLFFIEADHRKRYDENKIYK